MMERVPSPIPFPNTFRDSNDVIEYFILFFHLFIFNCIFKISTTTTAREFVLPSAPINEQMDYNHQSRHSIIRPVDNDRLTSPRINSPNQHCITNRVSWFFFFSFFCCSLYGRVCFFNIYR
jgi:hypothetical protein